VTESWRKLHAEELYNLYSSPNSINIYYIRKRTGHVALMWAQLESETLKGRGHFEDLCIYGKTRLK
jgi:hypothetical protein